LSIVKRLADLLDHPVRVASHFGRGTVFAIDVPFLAAVDPAPGLPASVMTAEKTGPLQILVVEDDPDLAEMLGLLLRAQGHKVTIATDGVEALASVARFTPDLMVADYNLPDGPNGLDLAASIRTATHRPVPVIILTGDISNTTQRAVTLGGCTVLSKPVSAQELRQTILQVMTPPAEGAQPVIFVIDDDDDVRGALMAVLEADGRAVAGFPSGEAFFQSFRPGSAACVLIDAALPGMSGIDVLERLHEAGHAPPAIVITGHSDVPMAIRAMKAGAADFIEKPVERAGLLASVARAIEGAGDATRLAAGRDAAAAQVASLTARQREIMRLVLAGHPSKNIAADLGISQRTVENHRASIMRKTGSASLPALARLALAASPELV
jgi:two-component system CheB/CheR fusion protein